MAISDLSRIHITTNNSVRIIPIYNYDPTQQKNVPTTTVILGIAALLLILGLILLVAFTTTYKNIIEKNFHFSNSDIAIFSVNGAIIGVGLVLLFAGIVSILYQEYLKKNSYHKTVEFIANKLTREMPKMLSNKQDVDNHVMVTVCAEKLKSNPNKTLQITVISAESGNVKRAILPLIKIDSVNDTLEKITKSIISIQYKIAIFLTQYLAYTFDPKLSNCTSGINRLYKEISRRNDIFDYILVKSQALYNVLYAITKCPALQFIGCKYELKKTISPINNLSLLNYILEIIPKNNFIYFFLAAHFIDKHYIPENKHSGISFAIHISKIQNNSQYGNAIQMLKEHSSYLKEKIKDLEETSLNNMLNATLNTIAHKVLLTASATKTITWKLQEAIKDFYEVANVLCTSIALNSYKSYEEEDLSLTKEQNGYISCIQSILANNLEREKKQKLANKERPSSTIIESQAIQEPKRRNTLEM